MIEGEKIKFGERTNKSVTHAVRPLDLMVKHQAEFGLQGVYFAGGATGWRRRQGKWASLTKNLCRHGEWGEVLQKYDLNRSSMDDLIRRFEDEATWEVQDRILPESGKTDETSPAPQTSACIGADRRRVNERTPDEENEKRAENITAEVEKRRGIKPTFHKTLLNVQRRNLDPQKLELYHAIKSANKNRVDEIMRRKIDEGIEEVLALDPAFQPPAAAEAESSPGLAKEA